MKMDSSIINREGVEKMLTMLPTEEEVGDVTLPIGRCDNLFPNPPSKQ